MSFFHKWEANLMSFFRKREANLMSFFRKREANLLSFSRKREKVPEGRMRALVPPAFVSSRA
jgi:hypothetical protein